MGEKMIVRWPNIYSVEPLCMSDLSPDDNILEANQYRRWVIYGQPLIQKALHPVSSKKAKQTVTTSVTQTFRKSSIQPLSSQPSAHQKQCLVCGGGWGGGGKLLRNGEVWNSVYRVSSKLSGNSIDRNSPGFDTRGKFVWIDAYTHD